MKTNLRSIQHAEASATDRVVETRLSIVVPYTTPAMTQTALKHAADLSAGLNATIRLIDAQVVPMQCPLAEPPVNREFRRARLQEIAEAAGIPVQVEMVYTRDRLDCFRRKLAAGSLIVIATAAMGMPFWPTAEKKLARILSRAGYDVVLVPRASSRGVR